MIRRLLSRFARERCQWSQRQITALRKRYQQRGGEW